MQDFFEQYHQKFGEFIHDSLSEAGSDHAVESAAADLEFNRLAIELFNWQFASIGIYQRFCRARGTTPDRVNSWRDIPALPISAFKDFEVTALAPHERTAVFYSSGTTQFSRSRHFHNPSSLAIYEASLLPWFRYHLTPKGSAPEPSELQWSILTPPPAAAPHSSLVHMFGTIASVLAQGKADFFGEANTGGWSLNLHSLLESFRTAETNGRPVVLLGAAFSFVQLLDALGDGNLRFRLPTQSRLMETGGYKGRSRELAQAELYALIEERLGIRSDCIVSEYGMCELSSQAYNRIAKTDPPASPENRPRGQPASPSLFRFPPWVRVQVISTETGHEVESGQPGLLRIVDLANASSVVAVQTEDLASASHGGFELLGRASQATPRGCSLLVNA